MIPNLSDLGGLTNSGGFSGGGSSATSGPAEGHVSTGTKNFYLGGGNNIASTAVMVGGVLAVLWLLKKR